MTAKKNIDGINDGPVSGDTSGGPSGDPEPEPVEPIPSVEITRPGVGGEFQTRPGKPVRIPVRGTVKMFNPNTGQYMDVNPFIDHVEVRFGMEGAFNRASPQSSGDWSRWSSTGQADVNESGQLEITARAINNGQEMAKAEITVNITLDRTDPELEIIVPEEGDKIRGSGPVYTVSVVGTASDQESGVQEVYAGQDNSKLKRVLDTGGGYSTWLLRNVDLEGTGRHTLRARAVDNVGNTTEITRTVTTVDDRGPDITIATPKKNAQITFKKGKTIRITGTATDETTGVSSVKCRIGENGEVVSAELDTVDSGEGVRWNAELEISRLGENTITVQAEDGVGNRESVTRVFTAAASPDLIALGTAHRHYLKDLLLFAGTRIVRKPSGGTVDEQLLTDMFHQPFGQLSFTGTGSQEVSQVRVAVEVLRGFLGNRADEIESDYPRAAYRALLRQLGTSYQEIRLTRGADEETRHSLAERLGIQPDKLDRLFIPPEELSEARLEDLFGLTDTTRNPLEPLPAGSARLLLWRQQYLQLQWEQADQAVDTDDKEFPPIVDPDLIDESDLANAVEGNTAFALFKARQDWIANQLDRIRKVRQDAGDPNAAFEAVIEEFLGFNLDTLAERRQQGLDIQTQLDKYNLDLAAFLHLLPMQRLAETEKIRESDWKDVDSILLQVLKRDEYFRWREEEKGLALAPRYFQRRGEDTPEVQMPRWRASRKARRIWEDTLESRIRQQEEIERTLQQAVDEVEQSTLPILRDALVSAAVETRDEIDADWLTQRLAIDVSSRSEQKTTRVRQAIETLQSVLFSVRAGRFGTLAPDGEDFPLKHWAIIDKSEQDRGGPYNESHFDREWQWMGNYGKWRSAMAVFLHPENYLRPTLRQKDASDEDLAFWKLVNALRDETQLTRSKARELVRNEYFVPLLNQHSDLEQTLDEIFTAGNDCQEFTFEELTELRSQNELSAMRCHLREYMTQFDDPADIPNELKEVFFFVPLQVALRLQKSGEYLAALDWFQLIYAYDLPRGERKIYYGLVLEEDLEFEKHRSLDWLLNGLNPHQIVNIYSRRPHAYTQFTLQSLVRCLVDFADEEFARETAESLPKARGLYMTAMEQLDHPALKPPEEDEDNPFPPNDLPVSLRRHAETNLRKLRQGRSIAGMQLPAVRKSDRSHPELRQAIPYRYSALIERAKQLVGIAQQLEANYLSALEKRDREAYTLLQAEQDVEVTRATVDLQDLRFEEARGNLELAVLQQEKARIRSETYGEWINEGLMKREESALAMMGTSAALSVASSVASGVAASQDLGKSLVSFGLWGNSAEQMASSLSSLASASSTTANMMSTWASYERRKQRWELQKGLAEQEIEIGQQQIAVSRDHLQVVGQEREIAALRVDHTEESIQFLADKFTSAELYEWMSDVLSQVYAYFLQQAASMARLAQRQLAFQRQATLPATIQADYWRTPEQAARSTGSENGQQTDRRGLTGSARLLEDIYRLDQYAFKTRQRKLEVSQTFSLSRLAPHEFQQFRETGNLLFETPRDLFDRAFPGHHLRLIKRVRLSVVALVPPVEGIKASLSTSGLSRVVTGAPDFETTMVRHFPEQIAFTSPANATGVLELQPRDEDLLFPFEDMGVDTTWELEMPRPANTLDYGAISDVLLTVEYTALHSDRYRQQVIRRLGQSVSEERSFSFRNQFPDQWYDLHNPDRNDSPMMVQFDTRREDFAHNLDDLQIRQILLYFDRSDGSSFELEVDHLHLIRNGTVHKGGEAGTVEGVISTRRANGASWVPLAGNQPAGTWELALPDSPKIRDHFNNEQIDDMIFVIAYEGRMPSWPE